MDYKVITDEIRSKAKIMNISVQSFSLWASIVSVLTLSTAIFTN